MEIKVNDIFCCDGDFFQVVKATSKTVTVKHIRSKFIGFQDSYGWEKGYIPMQGDFCNYCMWSDDQNENGKRCTVKDFSIAKDSPFIKVNSYTNAYLWDGASPSVFDSYN